MHMPYDMSAHFSELWTSDRTHGIIILWSSVFVEVANKLLIGLRVSPRKTHALVAA